MNRITYEDIKKYQSSSMQYSPLVNSSSAFIQMENFFQNRGLNEEEIRIQFNYFNQNQSFLPFNYISLPTLPFTIPDEPYSTGAEPLLQIMSIKDAEKYYEENKDKFLQNFEGKYLAIINENSYKVGDDFASVAQSAYQEFGYQDIFITKVIEETEIIRLTRPRLQK